jgi:hypothetical protein
MKIGPDRQSVRNSELEWVCGAVLRSSFQVFADAEIRAAFYPYIGLTHSIRRRGSQWLIRISDHCREAPREVLEALAHLLGSKIARRKPSPEMVRIYDRFRGDPEVLAAVHERRRNRGRKRIAPPAGKHHSLEEIYRELNHQYFNDQIEVGALGWGPRQGWRRLAHYDPTHNTITISPALDSGAVPRSAVAFVVYHEMLHALFNDVGERAHHPPAFRRVERAYADYARAKAFLARFSRSRGRLRLT